MAKIQAPEGQMNGGGKLEIDSDRMEIPATAKISIEVVELDSKKKKCMKVPLELRF